MKKVLIIILVIAIVGSVWSIAGEVFYGSAVPKSAVFRYVKKHASELETFPYEDYVAIDDANEWLSDEAITFIKKHAEDDSYVFYIDYISAFDANGHIVASSDNAEFLVFHCRRKFSKSITEEYTHFYYSKTGNPFTHDQGDLQEVSPGVFECDEDEYTSRHERIVGNWYYQYEAFY